MRRTKRVKYWPSVEGGGGVRRGSGNMNVGGYAQGHMFLRDSEIDQNKCWSLVILVAKKKYHNDEFCQHVKMRGM